MVSNQNYERFMQHWQYLKLVFPNYISSQQVIQDRILNESSPDWYTNSSEYLIQ